MLTKRGKKTVFFGRDKEINALYHLLQQSKLALVYGASGTGKTSLLNAGLPKAFKITDWFKISVRKGDDINASLCKAVEKYWEETPKIAELPQALQEIFEERWIPIYLIFDQFEEIFTLGEHEERLTFFTTLNEILQHCKSVKVILSMREEYLGHLYDYEFILPTLFDKRFRVEPMNDATITEVIYKTCLHNEVALEHRRDSADLLKNRLKVKPKVPVHLPHLQIYLYSLYEKLAKNQPSDELTFMDADIEQPDHTLPLFLKAFIQDAIGDGQDYLNQQFPAQQLPPSLTYDLLNDFATSEGTKIARRVQDLAQAHQQPTELIQAALGYYDEKAKLLRADENEPDRYEPVHDIVAQQIHEGRSKEEKSYRTFIGQLRGDYQRWEAADKNPEFLLKSTQLPAVDLYKERIGKEQGGKAWLNYAQKSKADIDAAERAKRRLQLLIVAASIATVVIMGVLTAWALQQSNNARVQTEIAQTKTKEALAEKNRAEENANIAIAKTQEAQDSAKVAQEARLKTIEVLGEAQQERDAAQKARDQIGLEKNATEEQRQIAEANLAKAEQAQRKAKEAEINAQNERDKAQRSLSNLQSTNLKVVDLLLENATEDILQLDYEAALKKVASAVALKLKKVETAILLFEIAFWHNEVGNRERALSLLDSTAILLNRNVLGQPTATREELRKGMRVLLPEQFAYLYEEKYYPKMIAIEGGTFWMGCDKSLNQLCRPDEMWHQQSLDNFKMAKYETTWWQYYLFCKAKVHEYEKPSWGLWGNNPAVNISWYDAVLYSNWLNAQKGLDTAYIISNKREGRLGYIYNVEQKTTVKSFQLPTEVQWEYAAKGGLERSPYVYSGSNAVDSVTWYITNSDNRTQVVGSLESPNRLGLHDMTGNVWEWCWDKYGVYSAVLSQNYTDVTEENGRILRGGSWVNTKYITRSSNRDSDSPDVRNYSYGFRLAIY